MTDRDPLDKLIGDLRTDVSELSDEAFAASLARLRTVIEPVPVTAAPSRMTRWCHYPKKRLLRSPPRRLIASAAAAVVLAVGVVFVQAARSDGPVPAASAAATLNSAADNVNPVDEPIEPGQYRYIASHSRGLIHYVTGPTDGDNSGPFIALDDWTHEECVPADLAQQCVLRSHATGRKWIAGDEERAKEAGIEPLTTETTSSRVRAGDPGFWRPHGGTCRHAVEHLLVRTPWSSNSARAASKSATPSAGPAQREDSVGVIRLN